jgi:hypothetical protein
MKKTILAMSLIASLVACSGSESAEPATTTDSTQVVTDSTKAVADTTLSDSTKVDTVEVK